MQSWNAGHPRRWWCRVAVKKAGVRTTKASAKLEGRVVLVGYTRSAAVKAYIAKQQPTKR